MDVDSKAWPKFDGTGPLDTFLLKVEYFMRISDMQECEKAPKLMQLIKGRAFTWLAHQPNWATSEFHKLVAIL